MYSTQNRKVMHTNRLKFNHYINQNFADTSNCNLSQFLLVSLAESFEIVSCILIIFIFDKKNKNYKKLSVVVYVRKSIKL